MMNMFLQTILGVKPSQMEEYSLNVIVLLIRTFMAFSPPTPGR